MSPFDVAALKEQLDELINYDLQRSDLWDDPKEAGKILQKKKSLENKIGAFEGLESSMEDINVLIEMAEEADDESLVPEIEETFAALKNGIEALRIETLLDGEYDKNNAILSIHAGSGGVDAQDWAEMLYRMYTRWIESKGFTYSLLDFQKDDAGGIKNATLLVEGENAYGYLKNERGVHRLVRISPFDSQARRHTSFSAVDVSPEIDAETIVDIAPEDIRVDTYRSSGAGGQHVNTTDSAIRITHIPTNIVVTCQNERSQHQNKEMAMRVLMGRLIELKEREHKDKIDDLKGDYGQITWGNQIRSYVFQPYTMVKDHRTNAEVSDVQRVMDGDLDYFINEKLKHKEETK